MKGYFMPHAPIILPTIGITEADCVSKTYQAMMQVGREIAEEKPDTIILISPHGPRFSDVIPLHDQEAYGGSLNTFGDFETVFEYKKDEAFIRTLLQLNDEEQGKFYRFKREDFERFEIDIKLDHGALVPLYFVQQFYTDFELVLMSDADFDPVSLMKAGRLIEKTAASLQKKVIVIASGDLSHTLSDQGPYHYHPASKVVDQAVVSAFQNNQLLSLASLDYEAVENAGICGLNSLFMLFGVYHNKMYKSNCMSYEGPFGVGYAVAKIAEISSDYNPNWLKQLSAVLEDKARAQQEKAHSFSRIAYEIIKQKVLTGISQIVRMQDTSCFVGREKITLTQEAFDQLNRPCDGLFVSIKKNGALRGCIGTVIGHDQETCYKQLSYYALQAAYKDPRFDPIDEEELSMLTVEIDLLSKLEAITLPVEHDVKKYGIYIRGEEASGVLLPNLSGVDNPVEQLQIALHKAGISVDEIRETYHFTVEKLR
jgi:AmmeMemoRadiSam system protein A/AmmeMemoRadiSam system protein B